MPVIYPSPFAGPLGAPSVLSGGRACAGAARKGHHVRSRFMKLSTILASTPHNIAAVSIQHLQCLFPAASLDLSLHLRLSRLGI